MRPVLQNMFAALNGGADEILFLKKETLRELLLEMQGMCVPAPANIPGQTPVICKPNRVGAGFTLSTETNAGGLGEVDGPYTMLGDALTPSALQVDTWDVEAPPGGTLGVIWKGPRLYFEATTTPDTTTDSNGDTTDWDLVTCILASRQLTFDSAGNLRTISAEIEMGSFSFR